MPLTRLLAWNLNHRSARHPIPNWVGDAISDQSPSPDIVVLTEYVEGPDHARFLQQLGDVGLKNYQISKRQGRSNQVLIAARWEMDRGGMDIPAINPHVVANFLHVRVPALRLDVVGLRVPMFKRPVAELKRQTWDWMNSGLNELLERTTIIAGDFNVAAGDAVADCGDAFERFAMTWKPADPSEGYSFLSRGHQRRIDHAFVSALVTATDGRYSWDFREFAGATSSTVGIPDHAMMIIDFDVLRQTSVAIAADDCPRIQGSEQCVSFNGTA